ncbi:heterokaryon incompatibility, partial [Macrophomina phaseolina]
AMQLVRDIGLRFLWIDALCIIQDDEDEKKRLIHGMDRVYEGATLTVFAAAGLDAAEGLPGIRAPDERIHEASTSVRYAHNSLELALACPTLVEQVRKSRWDTRAWTYQEQRLSKRCLYFTMHEVFFVC